MPARRRFPVTDHCDGRRFFNPGEHVNRTWWDVLRWKFTSRPAIWPKEINPPAPLPVAPAPRDGTLRATWINHATFLVQTRFGNVLTDPVYSQRASPFQRFGPQRAHAPGIPWESLPAIDVILLSHDHYDHCDLPTLRRLAARFPAAKAVTLLGNGSLLRRAGFAADHITELDWWQAHVFHEGFHVRATPARHWSNRLSGSRNGRLWGGFFIQAGGRTAHFVGDTGYDPRMFKAVADRCGSPDLAMIPIGAYAPRWFMAAQHCNPAEAVRIHQDLGARRSIGMHWGTFQLTDEPRDEPPQALAAALAEMHVPEEAFQVLPPGGSLQI